MKATDGLNWGEGYRPRRALAEIVAEDQWFGNLDGTAACDCRNLLSEPGDIELKVPRTRRPLPAIGSYVWLALCWGDPGRGGPGSPRRP